jgi:hypothetical protein
VPGRSRLLYLLKELLKITKAHTKARNGDTFLTGKFAFGLLKKNIYISPLFSKYIQGVGV